MRFGISLSFFLWVILLSGTATAACPAAPVGASADTVIQMRAHGGNAGMGPTTAMTATEEGAVVYDATKKTLVVCDGTNWIEMGGGGGDSKLVTGWPDIIKCTNGSIVFTLYGAMMPHSDGFYYYGSPYDYTIARITFTSAGAYNGHGGLTGFDCINKSISTLKSESKAFNMPLKPSE